MIAPEGRTGTPACAAPAASDESTFSNSHVTTSTSARKRWIPVSSSKAAAISISATLPAGVSFAPPVSTATR